MVNAFQRRFSPELHDLDPILAGEGSPIPGAVGKITDATTCILIHHILKGNGFFTIDGKTYSVHAGQIIIANTKSDITYISDVHDPWFYHWVGFIGELSEQFETLPTVLDVDEDPFPSLRYLQDPAKPLDYLLAGDLFHLYCRFLHPKGRKLDHIRAIISYIEKNYMEDLSVEAFAKRYGLDRRYLSRQFKKRTGFTIRGYISHVRIDAAYHFLTQGYSSKEVASMCGFSDISNFYKAFKEQQHMNPSEWLKEQQRKTELYWTKE